MLTSFLSEAIIPVVDQIVVSVGPYMLMIFASEIPAMSSTNFLKQDFHHLAGSFEF